MTASTKRLLWIVPVTILIAALVVRAVLPAVGRTAANYGLNQLDNYVGEIGSVDVSLTRGIFRFNGFKLRRRAGRGPSFIEADEVIVDVRMADLWRGQRVVDVYVDSPAIVLIWSPNPDERQLGERLRWAEFFNRLPVRVDDIEVQNGFVSLQDLGNVESEIDIEDIEVALRDMATTGADETDARAQLELAASVLGEAPIRSQGDFIPKLSEFAVTLQAELSSLPLRTANPWFEEFASLDAETGIVHARGNLDYSPPALSGQLRVQLEGASLIDGDDDEGGPFARIWEFVANIGLKVLQNDGDRLTRTMPIHAEVAAMPENPDLRQIVLTLIAAARQGIGRDADDPAVVSPPAGSE